MKESMVDKFYQSAKDFGRRIVGEYKKDEDIYRLDTRELIKLLAHSSPDSDREKMVIKAIEYRIQVNNKVLKEDRGALIERNRILKEYHEGNHLNNLRPSDREKFKEYEKIFNKEEKDLTLEEKKLRKNFYDLNEMVYEISGPNSTPMGANDSLITAAARYGHSKVVDLLVNKGEVDILSTRKTGHSSKHGYSKDNKDGYSEGDKYEVEEISALSYLREYQKKILPQRKIYIREYFIMPIAAIASAAHAVGKAIESMFAGEKQAANEESSTDIAKRLITEGDQALRERTKSDPGPHGSFENNNETQRVIRSVSEPLITNARVGGGGVHPDESLPGNTHHNSYDNKIQH